MIVERSMHASWLSNAFLLADEPGGTAVFVDSGAPLEPLLAAVEREGVTPSPFRANMNVPLPSWESSSSMCFTVTSAMPGPFVRSNFEDRTGGVRPD